MNSKHFWRVETHRSETWSNTKILHSCARCQNVEGVKHVRSTEQRTKLLCTPFFCVETNEASAESQEVCLFETKRDLSLSRSSRVGGAGRHDELHHEEDLRRKLRPPRQGWRQLRVYLISRKFSSSASSLLGRLAYDRISRKHQVERGAAVAEKFCTGPVGSVGFDQFRTRQRTHVKLIAASSLVKDAHQGLHFVSGSILPHSANHLYGPLRFKAFSDRRVPRWPGLDQHCQRRFLECSPARRCARV